MKPFIRGSVCTILCLAACGCGGARTRTWNGPRVRSTGESIYAPPVEPMLPAAPQYHAPPPSQRSYDVAPPVRPGDLEPMPTPALRLEQELPPPPVEAEESVQFLMPGPASPMPNALYPDQSRPLLEQSSAERPAGLRSTQVLGEGKIALRMQGHSTHPDNQAGRRPAMLMPIELEEGNQQPGMMQVQYVPLLAPVPNL